MRQISNCDYDSIIKLLSEGAILIKKNQATNKDYNMARKMVLLSKKMSRRLNRLNNNKV